MKKQSIKRQMIAVFICMIVCMIGAMWIINVRFLEPYYVRNKQTEFIKMYKELHTAIKKDNITDNTVSNRIQKMAEKNNISFLVLDNRNSDSDDVSIITNVHDKDLLQRHIGVYHFIFNIADFHVGCCAYVQMIGGGCKIQHRIA